MNMPQGLRFLLLAVTLGAGVALAAPSAQAQEISESHLAKAREAIAALGATDQFDNILPRAAQDLKAALIQASPNLQNEIVATVDETALTLAGRRGDLEREAARIYAEVFAEDELEAIAEFYSSTAGQKLLTEGPLATRRLLQAADIWASGIGRDLSTATNEALRQRLGDATSNPVDGLNLPAAVDGTAPAAPAAN